LPFCWVVLALYHTQNVLGVHDVVLFAVELTSVPEYLRTTTIPTPGRYGALG